MNKLQNLVFTGLIGLVAVGASACMSGGDGDGDGDGDQDSTATARPVPITTLNLANGARIDFFETAPGEILVSANGDLPIEAEDMRPLEMYELLAGQAAPAELYEAQVRADLALAARPPRSEPTADTVSTPARSELSSLTGSDFQSAWCNPGIVDFDYCWTNRTDNYSIDVSSVQWIHAHANACSGIFTLNVYRKTLFGWNLVYADTVTGSSYVSTYSTTDNDTYRVEITQASGDCWHLSVHGDK
jgi:hypothetical protein